MTKTKVAEEETTVGIRLRNPDGAPLQIATAFGVVEFGADGLAQVSLQAAASLFSHPDFTVPDADDRAKVSEFISKGLAEPDAYDAGELVRGQCRQLAGVNVAAPDGANVTFGMDGYALLGIKTAQALKSAMGDQFSYEKLPEQDAPAQPEKPEKPEQEKPKAKKPASKKPAEPEKAPEKPKAPEGIPQKIDV